MGSFGMGMMGNARPFSMGMMGSAPLFSAPPRYFSNPTPIAPIVPIAQPVYAPVVRNDSDATRFIFAQDHWYYNRGGRWYCFAWGDWWRLAQDGWERWTNNAGDDEAPVRTVSYTESRSESSD